MRSDRRRPTRGRPACETLASMCLARSEFIAAALYTQPHRVVHSHVGGVDAGARPAAEEPVRAAQGNRPTRARRLGHDNTTMRSNGSRTSSGCVGHIEPTPWALTIDAQWNFRPAANVVAVRADVVVTRRIHRNARTNLIRPSARALIEAHDIESTGLPRGHNPSNAVL